MHRIAFAIATLFGIAFASPTMAANEIVITQAKALAGNVTPGDTPGYPININTPGAYVLGSGLDVPAGQWGIVVDANGVDIDLSGYTLSGNGNGDYGIVSGYADGRIHDGIIAAFKASGLYIRGNTWTVERMKIERNSERGIDAKGTSFLSVLSTVVLSSGDIGIFAGPSAVLRDNIVSMNGNSGILCWKSCYAEGNLVDRNSNGIVTYSGMVIGNTISENTGLGIYDIISGADTGVSNNMLINNNQAGEHQTFGVVAVHPNTCVGEPC